jgi:type III pantothenate kinase
MILEIDVGNTRLKWRVRNRRVMVASGALGVEAPLHLLADEVQHYRGEINSVCIASVVGEVLEHKLAAWSVEHLGLQPIFARSGVVCGAVRNAYREPQMLGVDRWLGMVAAYQTVGGACVVVSCGTAVTVDLIARNGEHQGGFIAPGLNLMLNSLVHGTRQIKLEGAPSALDLSPAVSTSDAVYSACAAMLTGLIDNGVQQLDKFNQGARHEVIFTGGDANRLLPFYPQARLIPDLVLDGLAGVLDYPH